jgi:tRNA pseudouridine55 synthase
LNGLIRIDKPAGVTSMAVSARVRYLLKKAGLATRDTPVGHLGTLDPFATGLLPVLVGEANKLTNLLHGGAKVYAATARFGIATDTLDCDGRVVAEVAAPCPDVAVFEVARRSLLGARMQTPPAYSAAKIDGERAYDLARKQGADGEAAPRPKAKAITIYAIEPGGSRALRPGSPGSLAEARPGATPPGVTRERQDPLQQWPLVDFVVTCSVGTYVRVLAEEWGAALAPPLPAHLTSLRRLATGPFAVEGALPFEAIEAALADGAIETHAAFTPLSGLVAALEAAPEAHVTTFAVDAPVAARFRNGLIPDRLAASLPKAEPGRNLIVTESDGAEGKKPVAWLSPTDGSTSCHWTFSRVFAP